MNRRTTVVLVLAIVLMIIVMGIAAALHFTASVRREKWTMHSLNSAPAAGAEAMKVIDLTGDKNEDIMVQGTTQVSVLDENLKTLFEQNYLDVTTTMGDFDGDAVDDLLVVYDETGQKGIVAEALSLTQQQRDQILGVHLEHLKTMRQMPNQNQLAPHQAHQQHREEFEAQIRAQLNEDQQKAFQHFLEQHHPPDPHQNDRPQNRPPQHRR